MNTKFLADILTLARVLLGFYLAGLGLMNGKRALPTAVFVVVFSWLTDLVDGPLARMDVRKLKTWIGEHDGEADLMTSLGLIIYLISSDFVADWLGIFLLLTIVILWIFSPVELAWPFYVTPYVILIFLAFEHAVDLGLVMVGFLIFNLIVHWNRLWSDRLPRFFGAFRDCIGGDKFRKD